MRSLVLPWAIAASIAVHGGIFAAHLGALEGGAAAPSPPALYASLAPAPVASQDVVAMPMLQAPSDVATTIAPEAVPVASERRPPAVEHVAKAIGTTARVGDGLAIVRVAGRPLGDRNRIGELSVRQLTEFPVEVDRPVRMDEPIIAHYPKAALAQGREDSVGVWIVVNAQGEAEEVQVLDGAPEFAEQVVAAVNAAKFIPAENRLRQIRFPIALEFQFRVADAAPATVAKTATR
jgi:TonB family protein